MTAPPGPDQPPPSRVTVLADALCRRHDPGPGHPECPLRWDAARLGAEQVLDIPLDSHTGPAYTPAADDDILLCHEAAYLETVRHDAADEVRCLSTGDTDLNEWSLEAAFMAAGLAMAGVDSVVAGPARRAFCLTRPPGHHATRDRGMGFCIFNNAAIAARHAQRAHGIERVLIVDWDLHHGNGTQDIVEDDASVFYFSTHQWPLFPGTGPAASRGTGRGRGTTLNCPLAMGSGLHEVRSAVRGRLIPAMADFRPELVLISAGFDAHAADPLGGLCLESEDFGVLTGLVLDIADTYAGGKVVSVLEGGYHLPALQACAAAHVRTLARP